MDQATRQNAAMVEDAAGASTALHERAGSLSQLVSVFRVARTAAAPGRLAAGAPAPAARPAADGWTPA